MPTRMIVIRTGRTMAAVVLGAGVLWQVAARAGQGDGEAVIHVTASGVAVQIDGDDYPYEPWPASPIVCSLRPGIHTLTMTRGGRTLHDETFSLEPNGNIVLTARDEPESGPPLASK